MFRTKATLCLMVYFCFPFCLFSQTWHSIEPRATDHTLFSIYFLNQNTGWAVGELGTLLGTSDGGFTWTSMQTGVTDTLFDVKFVDAQTGWMCGSNGLVLKTIDGGQTWQSQPKRTNFGINQIELFGKDTIWLVSKSYNILLFKSENSGALWRTVYFDSCQNYTNSFLSSGTIICSGAYGLMYRTDNSGTTWSKMVSPDYSGFWRAAFFLNDSTAWFLLENNSGGMGAVYVTHDGCKSWVKHPYNSMAYYVHDMLFTDTSKGYILARYVSTYGSATSDGGMTWINDPGFTDIYEECFKLVYDKSNNMWTVGTFGAIYTNKQFSNSVKKPRVLHFPAKRPLQTRQLRLISLNGRTISVGTYYASGLYIGKTISSIRKNVK
jgi:photosystem II stability/assembly factor-like uncharacterized protein